MKAKKYNKKVRRAHSRARSFVANPAPRKKRRARRMASFIGAFKRRARRAFRSNPSLPIVPTLVGLGAGTAAGVVGSKLMSKLPVSALIQNLIMLAVGGGAMVLGRRKPAVFAAGLGLGAVAGFKLVTNAVPMLAGDNELNQDEQQAVLSTMAGEYDEMAGEFDDIELVNGPIMNGPIMNGESVFSMNG